MDKDEMCVSETYAFLLKSAIESISRRHNMDRLQVMDLLAANNQYYVGELRELLINGVADLSYIISEVYK
jgi:hypothetical protein